MIASDQAQNSTQEFGPFTSQADGNSCISALRWVQQVEASGSRQTNQERLQQLQAQVTDILGEARPQPQNASDLAERLKKLPWTTF